MKKIILIITLLLLTGCDNKVSEYKEVSDVVVGLFQKKYYNSNNLNETQKDLIDDYILSLDNPEINVSNFIVKDTSYSTNEENTDGIYMRDNKCYIKYNDIVFKEAIDHTMESIARVVCNGYYTILFDDSVKPMSIDYSNPKYNYRYLGYYKKEGYHFAYRSYYDGSGLIVSVNDMVSISFEEVDDISLKQINNVSYSKYILLCIFLSVIVSLLIFVKKRKQDI